MPRRIDFEALDKKYPAMPRVQSRYLSRVPAVIMLCSSTGGGKTVMAVALIQKLRRENSINRVFVISPTAASNAVYDAICTDPARDWKLDLKHTTAVFDDIKKIEAAIEADAQQYYDDLEYTMVRNKYCEGAPLSGAEEHMLEARGYEEVRAVRPSPAIFVDDAVSSHVFSNNPRNYFTQLTIRCRHVGLGTVSTIVLATQGIKMIPRPIRLNTTDWFVWRTSSRKEKDILFEEAASAFMPAHEFERKFDLMTALPYSYMHIDCGAKTVSDTF
jgi:hypothetical protein